MGLEEAFVGGRRQEQPVLGLPVLHFARVEREPPLPVVVPDVHPVSADEVLGVEDGPGRFLGLRIPLRGGLRIPLRGGLWLSLRLLALERDHRAEVLAVLVRPVELLLQDPLALLPDQQDPLGVHGGQPRGVLGDAEHLQGGAVDVRLLDAVAVRRERDETAGRRGERVALGR